MQRTVEAQVIESTHVWNIQQFGNLLQRVLLFGSKLVGSLWVMPRNTNSLQPSEVCLAVNSFVFPF
jgi:hypothetical protein